MLEKFIKHVEFRKGKDDQAAIYGLIGECGEVIDIIKKHKFHGHELDIDKLSEEVGDSLFYFIWKEDFHIDHASIIDDFLDEFQKIFLDWHAPIDEVILNIIFGTINEYNLDINKVMSQNIEKLEKRYPNGFDKNRSINR